MDTKVIVCAVLMLVGGFLLGLARDPLGGANMALAIPGMLLIAGPIFYLGESRK